MTLQTDFAADMQGLHPHVGLNETAYAINISLKNRYIYVETPKCACSTIKLSLQRLEFEDASFNRAEFEDIHQRDFSPLLHPRQVPSFRRLARDPRYFKFCFVRHPASRLLSAYLDKIARHAPAKKSILLQLGLPENQLAAKVTFKRFVEAVCEQPISMMDLHWRVQYYQTMQAGIKYDFIGRFETLAADLRIVAERIGNRCEDYLLAELRNQTKSTTRQNEYLTPALLRLIYDKFRIDYDHFDYPIKP